MRKLRQKSFPFLTLLAMSLPLCAAETLDGRVGTITTITGDDWVVSNLELAVELGGPALKGQVRIGTLELRSAGRSFSDVVIDCGRIDLTTAEFACRDATFTLDLPGSGRQAFPGEGVYDRQSGELHFKLRQVPFAQGEMRVSGTIGKTSTDIAFTGKALQIAELAGLAGTLAKLPDGLTASGSVDLDGELRTDQGQISRLTVRAELSDASIANEPGTLVTASMHSRIEVDATRAESAWQFTLDAAADSGELYVEPVYANLKANPVTVTAVGSIPPGFAEVALREFSLHQGSILSASGDLRIRMPQALRIRMPQAEGTVAGASGTIRIRESSFDAIYSGLLQVFMAGTVFGNLETAGTVSGEVTLEDNRPMAADFDLRDLTLHDQQGRFDIQELNGTIHWPGPDREAKDAVASRLRWSGASAYRISFGAGTVSARLGGNDFQLLEPTCIPTMGGALCINRLSLSNIGRDDAGGLLDAELEPIELGQLTAAFGWPAFSGSLSGNLPLLQYEDGVMTLGGTLTAKAFDGNIEFSNLKLEQPFGLVPRLYGDLKLRQLDLEMVTNTFSFGLIQGRLSGDVTGLQLVGWRPVAMDLNLYTPPGDTSRHRISQRAVENLASVGGGGAAAALSSGFMKFFDEFSYDKIGIRCVLRNGTCDMSGAGPAGRDALGGGYYIVKGSGLPRIDVVGYRSQVSWPRLMRQLAGIMASGAPVVK